MMTNYLGHRLVILFLLAFFTNAQVSKVSAQIHKAYSGEQILGTNQSIDLEMAHLNKVHIFQSKDNTAKFELIYTVEMEVKNKELYHEIFENVSHDFKLKNDVLLAAFSPAYKSVSQHTGLFMGAYTKIKFKNGKVLEIPGKTSITVSLNLHLPASHNIKVNSTFCTTHIDHINNKLDIIAKHTSIHANDVEKIDLVGEFATIDLGNILSDSKFDLKHSKLEVLNTQNLHATLNFSTLDINSCKNIDIPSITHSNLEISNAQNVFISHSQFSKIEIAHAKKIEIAKTEHGKLKVEQATDITIDKGAFTKMILGDISNSIQIVTSHSNMEVENIQKNFSHVSIINHFATINIGTSETDNFKMYITESQFTTVRNRCNNVDKKADGYYEKQLTNAPSKEISFTCAHCTINIK